MQFTDFVADPLATIGALYDQLGMVLTRRPKADAGVPAAQPRRRRRRRHRYTFADTGLDADELRERSRAYQERFGVASEPLA